MKRKKLVIISHTEHYKRNGEIVGWGSTVNEINYLAEYWDEIVHIACFYQNKAPKSSLPYTNENIKFVALPPYGGKSFLNKFLILLKAPRIMIKVFKNCKGASEVQLRLPTSMGLFLLPLFTFVIPRKFTFWVKYAGDWGQINPPLSNRIQRFWLKKNWSNCKVTINGFWVNQPKHCFSFENPCLTSDDIELGKKIAHNKVFEEPYNFCFVGRLDEVKGVSKIISSFKKIPLNKINAIHLIGDGKEIDKYINQANFLKDKIFFHGFQEKKYVHFILKTTHFFLLPSSAEGFPKVVAEAACYGAIPIVSNVGSISHYINKENGFVWKLEDKNIMYDTVIEEVLKLDTDEFYKTSNNVTKVAEMFTFDNYYNKLQKNIL